MARLYVVMKEPQSPIACFLYPRLHEIYPSKKDAGDRAEELNRKSKTNRYWVESVPFIDFRPIMTGIAPKADD